MGKKSKRRVNSKKDDIRLAPNIREEEEETAENLRFEDPYVDEIEEEDAMETQGSDDEGFSGEQMNDIEVVQSWHPLMGVPTEEPLEMDPSAYKMYHTLSPEWPALTFDFLRDDLGDARQRFPHSLQAAIGTQADRAENNRLTILKLSELSRLAQEDEEDILGDEYDKDDDKDDDSSEGQEDFDLDPILEHYHVPHYGGVNRLRAMPQQSDIIATWSDVGNVSLFNVENVRSRFSASEGKGFSKSLDGPDKPFFTYSGHSTEGFAIDWSRVKRGYLATGDNNGSIHLWTPRPEGGYEVSPSYDALGGGKESIEDIQWSPTEGTVFCAAESGGHIAIYDTRAPNKAMLRPCIHEGNKCDVNVISWNRLVSNLLSTGGDDGTLSVWDLRHFASAQSQKKSLTPLARFSCHKTPITSVEWHPTDESMLAVSDTVGAYIYDLSVEEDNEVKDSNTIVADIPPQLLFCHSGSQDFKELHWHPQISSCVMTTAFTGFSVFIPSNL